MKTSLYRHWSGRALHTVHAAALQIKARAERVEIATAKTLHPSLGCIMLRLTGKPELLEQSRALTCTYPLLYIFLAAIFIYDRTHGRYRERKRKETVYAEHFVAIKRVTLCWASFTVYRHLTLGKIVPSNQSTGISSARK